MASSAIAALCALVATAFWTFLGFAAARQLLPRGLRLGAAPVLGWAVHSAVTLPLFFWIGFSPFTVLGVAALCVAGAAILLLLPRDAIDGEVSPAVPLWAFAAAAMLALAPAVAIVPKVSAGEVHLADPIFDHSKIAIVDAMMRSGLPPLNPIIGAAGTASHLVYYYLWHFSAAQLALPWRATGWEADIGLTWFTAFASLSLMMGVAVWLSKRSPAAVWVVLLAAAGSLRELLGAIFGSYQLEPLLLQSTGFAGWLFQAAWVPQHLMAASCVVLALILIARCAVAPGVALLAVLALVVVAGFESSTYVGGVTFAVAALAATAALLAAIDATVRWRFIAGLASAAVLGVCLASPFVLDQFGAVAARGDASPIIVRPFAVLGALVPGNLRRALDLPAYWLLLLPIEFPATFIAGTAALVVLLRTALPTAERLAVVALASLAGSGLAVSWLLVSTLGDNNDLGLRGAAGGHGVDRERICRPDAAAAPPLDRRRGGWRPGAQPARRGADDPLQHRRHAAARRRGVRADAGAVAGGAPRCTAGRPCGQ